MAAINIHLLCHLEFTAFLILPNIWMFTWILWFCWLVKPKTWLPNIDQRHYTKIRVKHIITLLANTSKHVDCFPLFLYWWPFLLILALRRIEWYKDPSSVLSQTQEMFPNFLASSNILVIVLIISALEK